MPQPFDSIIARAHDARDRSRKLRAQLDAASAAEAKVIADESWRIMQHLIDESCRLQAANKALRDEQLDLLSGPDRASS